MAAPKLLEGANMAIFPSPKKAILRCSAKQHQQIRQTSFAGSQQKMGSGMVPLGHVIANCNKLAEAPEKLWKLYVLDIKQPIGLMLPEVAEKMIWGDSCFQVSVSRREVRLEPRLGPSIAASATCCSELIKLCERNANTFDGLSQWLKKKSDFHPVRLGKGTKLQELDMPSPLRGLLGIVTTGVHLNMYTQVRKAGEGRTMLWVARRTEKVTFPGMLDQVVAGAMAPGDHFDPLRTLAREAKEETGIFVDLENLEARVAGVKIGKVTRASIVTFYDKKGKNAGSEEGHIEPGLRYNFDIEVDPVYVPTPTEPQSIMGFLLCSVDQVKETLRSKTWKPNSGLVTLDFLLRHGLLTHGDVTSVEETRRGLQRELPFELGADGTSGSTSFRGFESKR